VVRNRKGFVSRLEGRQRLTWCYKWCEFRKLSTRRNNSIHRHYIGDKKGREI